MSTTLAPEPTIFARAQALLPCLRTGERVAIVFFLYLSALSWIHALGFGKRLLLPAAALLIYSLAVAESTHSCRVTRVVRDWLSLGLILAGYWSIGWFVAPPLVAWQERWLEWDRVILEGGLRAFMESAGFVLPSLLETAYLLLYAAPPIALCILYRIGGRNRVHEFLFLLLLGTFAAYSVLPLFPVHGPHVAYPAVDLPNFNGAARLANVWILDHLDMPTSVFPSGHVAVAFSTAFGLYRAVRTKPAIWGTAFVYATLVFAATIYCRYHYAMDGLGSLAVVTTVCTAAGWKRDAIA